MTTHSRKQQEKLNQRLKELIPRRAQYTDVSGQILLAEAEARKREERPPTSEELNTITKRLTKLRYKRP